MTTSILSRALRALTVSALTAGLALSSLAGTYSWNKVATGTYNWNASANWTATPSGFPNAVGDVANITANATGYVTNALNQATVTVGILNIGDTDIATRRPFRIVPTSIGYTLVFNNGTAPAQLNQTSTSSGDLIAAPVQIANALTVSSATPDRSLTISGAISGSASTLTKTGLGEILLTSANTFQGLLSVQAGRLVGTAQASGSPFGAATNTIQIGGSSPLVASYVPTLSLSNPTAASTTPFGDLTAGGSFNSGYLTPGAAVSGTSYLQGEDLVRNAGATLVVSPLTTTSLADTERVQFSGSGTSLVNTILPPWLVVALNNGDFASYGANGIARATYTATAFNPSLTTQVVNLASAASLAAPQTAYAVRLGANLNLNGNSLNLGDGTTGGLILLNNTTLSNSGAGSLAFGSGELLTYVDGVNSATISAPLSGSGTFRKFGTGTLTLTYPGLHSGNLNMQAGSLYLNPTADFTYTGNITGAGTLYKDGTRSISLPGNACALGGVWLKSGTVALSNASVTNLTSLNMAPTVQGSFPGATLSITNGSVWTQVNGSAVIGNAGFANNITANNHSVNVAGALAANGKNAVWNLGGFSLFVGSVANSTCRADFNKLTVGTGGIVTNVVTLSLARSQGGTSNRVEITDGGRVYSAGTADIGHNGNSNTLLVSGDGSLWNNGGGVVNVGTSGGSSACSYNELLVTGSGAVVTNLGSVSLGVRTGGGTTTRTNIVTVTNGARMYSRSEMNVGVGNSGASYGNIARVTGTGSTWNLGGALMRIGYSSQGSADGNWCRIDNGGVITNAGLLYVGHANAVAANRSTLEILEGGKLYSTGATIIGRANSGTSQPRAANFNGIRVSGENARWNLGGASLTIGNATAGLSYPLCTATSNWLRVERGSVTSIGALTVGNGALAVNNRIELAGGSLSSASLTLNASNLLAPTLDAQGLTAMTVTGAATFSAGSWIDPDATRDAPAGTYTVLTANSIVGGGNLTLAPGTDESIWSLQVTSTQVKITKRDRATLLQIR